MTFPVLFMSFWFFSTCGTLNTTGTPTIVYRYEALKIEIYKAWKLKKKTKNKNKT
jgi:hypothetical protein